MKFDEVDVALKVCEQHLLQTKSAGTEVEAHLTRSALVLVCAVFEEAIKNMLRTRAESLHDTPMCAFINSSITAIFRSYKSSELAGLLGRFGQVFKIKFQELSKQYPKAVTYYDNIVTNRDQVAHSRNIGITLPELRKFYEEGHVVLDFVQNIINETLPGVL